MIRCLLSLDCIICNFTYLGSNHNPLAVMNKWLILTANFETVNPADAPHRSGVRPVCVTVRLLGNGPSALCFGVAAAVGQKWLSPCVLSSVREVPLSVGSTELQ